MSRSAARHLLVGVMLASTGPAWAHHPMDGRLPGTAAEGLLSGLAHPVIGLDHLAFVVGIGILSAFVRQGWVLPAMFLGAGAVGTALHIAGATLPAGELLVALTVMAMAAGVYLRSRANFAAFAGLTALGGLAHGYALAESIVGAEPSPLWAYLAGLVIVQLGLSLLVREAVRRLSDTRPAILDRVALTASAAILAVGLVGPFAG